MSAIGPPRRFRRIAALDRFREAHIDRADETRDAMMNVYTSRFGQQVECVSTDIVLES
jgi:hypothetical protein